MTDLRAWLRDGLVVLAEMAPWAGLVAVLWFVHPVVAVGFALAWLIYALT